MLFESAVNACWKRNLAMVVKCVAAGGEGALEAFEAYTTERPSTYGNRRDCILQKSGFQAAAYSAWQRRKRLSANLTISPGWSSFLETGSSSMKVPLVLLLSSTITLFS